MGDIEKGTLEESTVISLQAELPADHQDYLLKRHGTLELDPVPTNDPNDPLNWSELKKNSHMILVSIQCMLATFTAAGIVPSYEALAEEYQASMESVPYFTSTMILIFGIAPLFWLPIMERVGRRPILLLSAIGSLAGNIGGGFCKTYGQQMATRVIVALFAAPALAVGSVVVTEMYFANQRGTRNGWWTALLTIGTPSGPFIMGFVQQHAGTRWVFWVFAFANFVNAMCWLIADETHYLRGDLHGRSIKRFFGIISHSPANNEWAIVWHCATRVTRHRVLIASVAYGVVFTYANVAMVVELPQAMGRLFKLDAQTTGLQFVALIIGTFIGEFLSGPLSDLWMKKSIKRRGSVKLIEDRLWVSYPGFICVLFGLIVWGVMLAQAQPGHWTVKPLIGAAFAAGGNQIITTVLITYSVDDDFTKSVETGLFINVIRQTLAFIGPFYFPDMFSNLGFGGAAGLMCGLVFVASIVPIIICHIYGVRAAKSP